MLQLDSRNQPVHAALAVRAGEPRSSRTPLWSRAITVHRCKISKQQFWREFRRIKFQLQTNLKRQILRGKSQSSGSSYLNSQETNRHCSSSRAPFLYFLFSPRNQSSRLIIVMAATLIGSTVVQPKVVASKTLASPRVFSRIYSPARILPGSLVSQNKGFCVSRLCAVPATVNADISVEDKKVDNPIIVIDNYDSFTYNLCQYMGELGCNFEVYRNDELTVDELKKKNPRGVLISPGPGAPQDSGISLQTVLELGPIVPLFGVCMGLQCIGEAFGGKIVRSPFGVMHGKSSLVYYDEKGEDGLFSGLSNPFTAGRYHSLVIENESFPSDELEITAWTEDGLVMAARHKKYKHLQGVQFHPESIITKEGKTIVRNFVKMIEKIEVLSIRSSERIRKNRTKKATQEDAGYAAGMKKR
ncbi:hypothetical protein NE237_006977 [Protea cynaroides]|uniref:anthranilate synthase n=1 Tax=Protea cynaroides TaxID=273540 RepID=A0A9Q0KN97_9MAGN|nr:hypothetical protein NE237_006977 [Protea cynaroides]